MARLSLGCADSHRDQRPRNAQVALPSLDGYEKAQHEKKIVRANFKVA